MRPDLQEDVDAIGRLSAVPQILKVVSASTGLRFAAVARVTKTDWIACAVRDGIGLGLSPGTPLDVKTTLCDTVRDIDNVIVMDDAPNDPQYVDHHTPKMFGFRSYISVPIHVDGAFFGTLCALDPEPAELKTEKVVEMFTLFADMIGSQLAQEQLQLQLLTDAERQTKLREQLIAVLGHDLRSPVAAIKMSAFTMQQTPREPRDQRALDRIENSSARIAGLVDDVMDFARASLGGGIEVARTDVDIKALVHRIVDETAGVHADRHLTVAAPQPEPFIVVGHEGRLGQVVANLVGNAIEHSQSTARVTVTVQRAAEHVVVDVHNEGSKIAADVLPTLFQPFFRGNAPGNREGLGLGLYIAAQIVAAHGGTIAAASDDAGTTFTFKLPGTLAG